MSPPDNYDELHDRVVSHLNHIYKDIDADSLAHRLLTTMGLTERTNIPIQHKSHWGEEDIAIITYGDTFIREHEQPLDTLYKFISEHLHDIVNIVHILPFFPFSSDAGFAVMEYTQVNEALGEWEDIEHIASEFKLMADLVINHCSARSRWFSQFKEGKEPGKNYFITVAPDTDLSAVVRPRTNPLLREIHAPEGPVYVWCTFGHDQPDLNFTNTDVLVEFVHIIHNYLEHGIKIFRLDAIAFLWKEIGTKCINLPQTHEIVRLLRTLIEHHTPDALIITETNIPNRENLEYFGNANEAHIVYNFSLPPLLLYTLLTGNCHYLKEWIISMPHVIMGTTYLNFIASHDGIGLRPAEGLLDEEEILEMTSTMEDFGGNISWRALTDDTNHPYEINISLYDALQTTIPCCACGVREDEWQEQRFLCAHAIMLALQGIPAFYIHSLFGTRNDYEKLRDTSNNRAINRHNWNMDELMELLNDSTHHARIYHALRRLIVIRREQAAFHPNAAQTVLHLGDEIFAFWREDHSTKQSIFALNNVSDQPQEITVADINLTPKGKWRDLIGHVEVDSEDNVLVLQPYQCVWLTNVWKSKSSNFGK